MKTFDITLASGKQVSLRLTSRAISNYVKEHGIEGAAPVVSIMSAVDNMESTIALLSAAMRYPGATVDMALSDGAALIDALADEGHGNTYVRGLIVQLAQDAGLLTADEAAEVAKAMADNSATVAHQLVQLLRGEAEPGEQQESAENPM